jgi:hypothetical protein
MKARDDMISRRHAANLFAIGIPIDFVGSCSGLVEHRCSSVFELCTNCFARIYQTEKARLLVVGVIGLSSRQITNSNSYGARIL